MADQFGKLGGKAAVFHRPVRCSKVEISGDSIRQVHDFGVGITIAREDIRQIRLLYDTKVREPFCQYFFGITLLLSGIIGLFVFFVVIGAGKGLIVQTSTGIEVIARAGDPLLPLFPFTLWLMCGLGFWLLANICDYRYHLVIDSGRKVQSIFFEKSTDIREIRHFIKEASFHFGYEIDTSAAEDRHSTATQGAE
jgi:hypothetical protein